MRYSFSLQCVIRTTCFSFWETIRTTCVPQRNICVDSWWQLAHNSRPRGSPWEQSIAGFPIHFSVDLISLTFNVWDSCNPITVVRLTQTLTTLITHVPMPLWRRSTPVPSVSAICSCTAAGAPPPRAVSSCTADDHRPCYARMRCRWPYAAASPTELRRPCSRESAAAGCLWLHCSPTRAVAGVLLCNTLIIFIIKSLEL